jgi:nucleotide-binding universal stress UspA family protein
MSRYAANTAPAQFRALERTPLRLRVGPTARQAMSKESAGHSPRAAEKPGELTFREVIVPLDGTPFAEHALPWAIQIAELAGAPLRMIHVHQHMQPAFHERGRALYRGFDRLLREPIEAYMAAAVRRVARSSDVVARPTVVDAPHQFDYLSELVASTSDIVVMATRGRHFVTRLLRGSALDAILSRREAAVLHVPGYACPVDMTARPSLRHALVPLDRSSDSAGVLSPVAALSKLADGRQTLFRVVQSEGVFSCGDGSSLKGARELANSPIADLDAIASFWRHELPHLRTRVVWSDAAPARTILREVEEQAVDFIAMAPRPRGRVRRMLRPGVTDRLIRRASTPILVVKQRLDKVDAELLSA